MNPKMLTVDVKQFEKAISAYYRASRSLTDGEKHLLSTVYGSSVDYSRIRIRKGCIVEVFAAAITLNNLICFSEEYYSDDFSKTGNFYSIPILFHEVCHVWQYQNHIKYYWWFKALLEQLMYGSHVYDYVLDPAKCLVDYRFEQMGKILQDYIYAIIFQSPQLPVYEKIIYCSIKKGVSKHKNAWRKFMIKPKKH